MADLGQATLELKTDNQDFNKGLNEAESNIGKFGTKAKVAFIALGAAVGAGLTDAVKEYADLGDQIGKISARTGVAHEFVSEFIHVIEQGGGSAGDLETVFMKFNTFLQKDFALGTAKATDAMQLMGLTTSDVQKLLDKPMQEALLDMINMLRNMSDENTQAEVAMMVLGKAGRNLLPVIRGTEEAMRDTMEEARRLGIVFDREAAVKAEDLADAFDELAKSQIGLKLAFGELAAPTMTDVSRGLSGIIGDLAKFIDSTGSAGEKVVTASIAIAALSVVIGALSFVALPVILVIGGVATAIVATTAAVLMIISHFQKFATVLDGFKAIGNGAIGMFNRLLSGVKGVNVEIPKMALTFQKSGKEIEQSIVGITDAYQEFDNVLLKNKMKYKDYISDMQSLQMEFNSFTVREIGKSLDEQNETREEKTLGGLNKLNRKVEQLTGIPLFTPMQVSQSKGIADAGVGISSGEAQLFSELAAGGTLQVSTGERDASGGVIFRDATQEEIKNQFANRIGGPPPSLLGMTPFNAGAERGFVEQSRAGGIGSSLGEATTFNISLNDKMIDQAVGERFMQEGLGGD